jgi:hypothetical protein
MRMEITNPISILLACRLLIGPRHWRRGQRMLHLRLAHARIVTEILKSGNMVITESAVLQLARLCGRNKPLFISHLWLYGKKKVPTASI